MAFWTLSFVSILSGAAVQNMDIIPFWVGNYTVGCVGNI